MATTVTPTAIATRRPEFASVDETVIQDFIDEALLEMNETAWGDKFDKGVLYLTLHLLTLEARADAATSSGNPALSGGNVKGALKWEQVGPTQRGYGDPNSSTTGVGAANGSNAWLEQTLWGSRYAHLRSLCFAPRVGALPAVI